MKRFAVFAAGLLVVAGCYATKGGGEGAGPGSREPAPRHRVAPVDTFGSWERRQREARAFNEARRAGVVDARSGVGEETAPPAPPSEQPKP